MGVSKKLIDVVLQQLPDHAEFEMVESPYSGATLTAFWKLNNDPKRLNKYSKTLAIKLPRELIEDFSDYPEEMKGQALAKIEAAIKQRLQVFDPDHDTPKYQQSPVVEWLITTEEIFG